MAEKTLEPGVYSIKGGGYRAAITVKGKDGKSSAVKDLGLFKTYEEARAVYIKAQNDMHPPGPPLPPGTPHVKLEPVGITTGAPKATFKR